jgi:hypothetical protein
MIEIKPSHRGRLRKATGTKKGAKVPLSKERALKAHGTPAEKKEANFAINAREWNHNPLRKRT